VARDLFSALPARGLGRRHMPAQGPLDLEELRHARALAARAVLLYGDDYMPVYGRLDAEVKARESREAVRDRLRAVAAEAAE
jgi:hypothetical protein